MADFLPVARDIYPVGRLDKDSEGLLILTNDKSLNSALLSPAQKHKRSYFVQLDNDLTDKAIQQVSKGVQIKIDSGIYTTSPCSVKKLQKPPLLPERVPPVRFRQNIPTSWALIELTEGKNRQVRKMFAAVDFPVLRLVRVQIEDLKVGKLEPGKYFEIKQDELFKLLKIDINAIKTSRYKKSEASSEKEITKPKTVSKPTKKKAAIPKSGYSNAPKKQSPERLAKAARSEKDEKSADAKIGRPTRNSGSVYASKPERTKSDYTKSDYIKPDHTKSEYTSSPKKRTERSTKPKEEHKTSDYKKPSAKKPTGKAPWQKSKPRFK